MFDGEYIFAVILFVIAFFDMLESAYELRDCIKMIENKRNTYIPPRRKRKINNFRFSFGLGSDFVDMDNSRIFKIHEYYEQLNNPDIPEKEKKKKIRVTDMYGNTIDWVEPEIAEERMKDPEPDPKYAYEPPQHGKW